MLSREILFRGKRLDNGEWAYGWPFADTAECSLKKHGECVCPHDGSEFYIVEWDDAYHEYEERRVDPATVGQYTGLKDKNGKRIFEGDIIKYGTLSVFEQRNMTAYFGLVYAPLETLPFGHYQDLRQIEIIGNIHDNKELLGDNEV